MAIHANAYLVDAIIGLSVVYKAFDNMDGFKRFFGFQPNTKAGRAGLRLVPRLRPRHQAAGIRLSPNGLVANIISFNVGVEVGQCLALSAILIALTLWRTREGSSAMRLPSTAS